MNFLTLGAKSLKKAQKAGRDQANAIEKAKRAGLDTSGMASPDEIIQITLDDDFKFMEQAMDVGLRFFTMAQSKLASMPSEKQRTYMLTVRPPLDCNWNTFYHACKCFIDKWGKKWAWAEWAYEQKGESENEAGQGFHIHLIFATTTPNYYPSHILRDAKSGWPFVAANCIQLDTLVNVEKGRKYIRGIKNLPDGNPDTEKMKAVAWDNHWRESKNLQQIYESGQVHPLS